MITMAMGFYFALNLKFESLVFLDSPLFGTNQFFFFLLIGFLKISMIGTRSSNALDFCNL